jgi:hypothetical protein
MGLARQALLAEVHHDADARGRGAGGVALDRAAAVQPTQRSVGPTDSVVGFLAGVERARAFESGPALRQHQPPNLLERPLESARRHPEEFAAGLGPG